MIFKNKKAMEMGQLIVIIITILAFILIATTITRALSKSEDKEAELLCHNSIALRMATSFNVEGSDVKLAPVLCKTMDKKVSGDREEIKEQMAYLMARCWWMFNEGRQDELLDDPNLAKKIVGLDKSENDCFLCYTVSIDEKEIGGGPIHPKELNSYLIENEHAQIKGMKYIDYIQSYGGPGKVAILENIDPQNAYGIAFLAKNKDGGDWGWILGGGSLLAGLVVGGAAVACAILEPCGAIAGTVAVAGGLAGGTAGVAAGTILMIEKAKAELYESNERSNSVVVVDKLNSLEANHCAKDIAGQ